MSKNCYKESQKLSLLFVTLLSVTLTLNTTKASFFLNAKCPANFIMINYNYNFRSTSLTDSPSIWHFSSHMGQLMRHSADSMGGPMGCAMVRRESIH